MRCCKINLSQLAGMIKDKRFSSQFSIYNSKKKRTSQSNNGQKKLRFFIFPNGHIQTFLLYFTKFLFRPVVLGNLVITIQVLCKCILFFFYINNKSKNSNINLKKNNFCIVSYEVYLCIHSYMFIFILNTKKV